MRASSSVDLVNKKQDCSERDNREANCQPTGSSCARKEAARDIDGKEMGGPDEKSTKSEQPGSHQTLAGTNRNKAAVAAPWNAV